MMNFTVSMTGTLSMRRLVSKPTQVCALTLQSFLQGHQLNVCSPLDMFFSGCGGGEVGEWGALIYVLPNLSADLSITLTEPALV